MKAKPLFLIGMSISVVILIVIIATITSRYQIKIYPGNEKLCNVKKIVTSDKAPPGRDKYLPKAMSNTIIGIGGDGADEIQMELQQTTLKMVDFCGNDEGIIPENITIYPVAIDKITLTVFTEYLHNDSIALQESRVDFALSDAEWKVEWIGERWGCMPGRGHQYLSAELCY